jgi:hypothetical protein
MKSSSSDADQAATYHQERCPGGYHGTLPGHIFDANTRQRHGNDSPEAQHLFAECLNIYTLLFLQAFLPRTAIGIDAVDFSQHLLLEGRALLAREYCCSEQHAAGVVSRPPAIMATQMDLISADSEISKSRPSDA